MDGWESGQTGGRGELGWTILGIMHGVPGREMEILIMAVVDSSVGMYVCM